MGLFGAKTITCQYCGEETTKERYARLKDGEYICRDCYKKSMVVPEFNLSVNYTSYDIKKHLDLIDTVRKEYEGFSPSQKVDGFFYIEQNTKRWYIENDKLSGTRFSFVRNFDEIVSYELIEDGETVTSGGLGRAAAGALLLGGVGAVVGGVTGKKKSKQVCNSLKIKITLSDLNEPTKYIVFIDTPTKKTGIYGPYFRERYDAAQKCLSMLEIIVKSLEGNVPTTSERSISSSADEIKKLKELLDMGAITQEEFDAKKTQLLGI